MSNNKTKIVTLPLNMSLNMNKNEEIISSDFSMVNKCSAPVYGSTLTNIHVKTDSTGNAIWDRNGERYFVEDGKLKSTNKSFEELDLSDKYFFEKRELSIYDIDGIITQEHRVYGEDTKQYYVAFKLRNGAVTLYKGENENSLEETVTITPEEGRNITAVRLIPLNTDPNQEFTSADYLAWNRLLVYTIQEVKMVNSTQAYDASTSNNTIACLYEYYPENGTLTYVLGHPVRVGAITNGSGVLTKKFSNLLKDKTGTSSVSTSQTNGNDWQIIVSSKNFRSDSYVAPFNAPVGLYYYPGFFGVTLLRSRLHGSNVVTDLLYDNHLYCYVKVTAYDKVRVGWNVALYDHSVLTDENKFTDTLINSSGAPYLKVTTRPTFTGIGDPYYKGRIKTLAYSSSAATSITETTTSVENATEALGIFVDDSPLIVAIKTDSAPFWNAVRFISHPFYTMFQAPTDGVFRPYIKPTSLGDLVGTAIQNFYGAFSGTSVQYGFPQASYGWSATTNQRYCRTLRYGRMASSDPAGKNNTASVLFDTALPGATFTSVGLQSTQTVPTTVATWNTWNTNQATDSSYTCYNSQGSIASVSGTKWRILFNYKDGYVSGISYGEEGKLGKLVTEWDSIDDGFYVYADDEKVIYKNTKNNKVYAIYRKAYSSIDEKEWIDKFNLVDARYLIGNVDTEFNAFDTVENNKASWSSDWNNRVIPGVKFTVRSPEILTQDEIDNDNGIRAITYRQWSTIQYDGASNFINTGSIASGQNVAYAATKSFSPSRIEAYQTYTGLLLGYETFLYAGSEEGVDYYIAKTATTPSYRYTVKSDASGSTFTFHETSMEGLSFPVAPSGTTYQNVPIVGVDYIESYNGKFAVKIDDTVYGIVYNGIRPVGLYNTASLTDDISEFFIVQGQYYAVVNGYIAAIYYNSAGTLSSIEQIIDVNGMQFVGAFPSVAYFWAPSTQSIYAFTGDADLQLFVQSNRINEITGHLYDPGSEWILLNTDDGLYVLTQINVFKSEYLRNVHSFWSTDDGYVVVIWDDDYKNTRIALRKLDDGYRTLPVELETVFLGPGDMQECILDTWYLRFFRNGEDYNGKIKVQVKTLTDLVKEGEEKTYTVTKDKFDKSDNFFLRFQPDLQRGQGVALKVTSDYPIAYIAASVSNGCTQLSRHNI